MPSINNLVYSDKFKKWFDTTNTIITTLNGITVYNLLQGDGVSLSSSGNVFTVSHAPTVTTGVTFNGSVRFNGSVSFATNPTTYSTTTINVSPKVSGITAGKFVRMDSTGLTLAKANSAVNAEVLGVVVNDTASAHVVALAGLLDNSLFANTIQNAIGTTLIPGEAYFLDSVVPGGITTNEPQTYGYVSKPVLLGVTGDSGSILTYRGVLLEGLSYGITAELDNKLIIEYDTNGGMYHALPMVGDVFLYFDDSSTGFDANWAIGGDVKSKGKVNNSTYHIGTILDAGYGAIIRDKATPYVTGKEFLGLVSRIISESSGVYILEITLPGGTITTQINQLDSNQYPNTSKTTALAFNTDLAFVPATGTTKVLDFIRVNDVDNTVKLVISRGAGSGTQGGGGLPPSGTTSTVEYQNLIPNGAFTVWQRPTFIGGTLSGSYTTTYTDDYLMQPFNIIATDANGPNTFYTYRLIDPVADRWFAIRNLDYLTYIDGAATRRGLTGGSSIYRRSFSSDQTSVPGSPLYYLDCVFNYSLSPVSSLAKRPRLENIQPNARLAQGQTVTFSFWGKSSVSGSTLDLIYNQYKPNYSDFTGLTAAIETRTNLTSSGGGITLTTAWKQYSKSFTVAPAGFTLADNELGWFGVGFEFPTSSATISLAQSQLHLGNYAITPVNIPYDKELERCRELYQTNFARGTTYIYNSVLNTANRTLGSTDLTGDNYLRCPVFSVSSMSCPFRYLTKMALFPNDFVYFSPVQGSRSSVYITNAPGGARNSSSINTTNNIKQGLPWQSSTFAAADIDKIRNPSDSGIAFTVSNIGKEELRINFRPGVGKTELGSGAVTFFDTIQFNYILNADITSSAYATTFAFPYSTTTIHY